MSAYASRPLEARTALAELRRFATFERVGVATDLRITSTSSAGHRLASRSSESVAMDAVVPAHSDEPLRIEVAPLREGRVWLDVRALDVSRSAFVRDGNAFVASEAIYDAHLIYALEPSRVEEIRVLRSPAANATARYELRVAPALRDVRVFDEPDGGRVEIVDAAGTAHFASEPMYAIDARGARRAITPKVSRTGEDTYELVVALDTRGLTFPIAIDPTWTAATNMPAARYSHASALLNDGQVFMVGGYAWDATRAVFTIQDEAFRFTPSPTSAGTWTTLSRKYVANPIAVTLTDGRVFVLGYSASTTPRPGHLYSPTLNSWADSAVLPIAGGRWELARLPSGEVLATSDLNAYVYSPANNTWASVGPMKASHSEHSMTLTKDNVVLVAGGSVGSAEIYEPIAKTWTLVGPMAVDRRNHAAVALPNGKVVAIGGTRVSTTLNSVEVYDPVAKTWATVRPMVTARQAHTATWISSGSPIGSILVVGSASLNAAEIYNPVTDVWTSTSTRSRLDHAAVRLNDGRVFVWGGSIGGLGTDGTVSRSAQFFAPTEANGASCALTIDCLSGICVDGFCCDRACTGQCEACDVTGFFGICRSVAGAPHGTRGACTGVGAGTTCGPLCDGSATSCTFPNTSTTCGTAACANAIATLAGTCNGSGVCSSTSASCGAYTCGATTCKTSCLSNADCAPGNTCNSPGPSGTCTKAADVGKACSLPSDCSTGNCVDEVCCATTTCPSGSSCNASPTTKGQCSKLAGTSCANGLECASALCVDGVCCNAACTGQCESCNQAGKHGACSPVTGAPPLNKPSCTGVSGLTCSATCDGTTTSMCTFPGAARACGVSDCIGNIERTAGVCNGSGACGDVSRGCSPYLCDAVKCKAVCATSDDCALGFYCKSNACVAVEGRGLACTTAAQCAAGLACTDGVCCVSDTCAADSACNLPKSLGLCAKKTGSTCTAGTECDSGSCVDGRCCDSACTGQCEACDVAGSEGKCSPVSGAPRGNRAACADGGAEICQALACDGAADRTKCAKFKNGATTRCKDATCSGSTFVAASACDGAGNCKAPLPSSCTPLACDPSGCLTTCTTNAQCSTDYFCRDGLCEPKSAATCTADLLGSTSKETGVTTSCLPYRCKTDGTCEGTCAGSEQCAPGFLCQVETKLCVVPAPPEDESSGGCAHSPAPTQRPELAFALLLAASGLAMLRIRGARAVTPSRASPRPASARVPSRSTSRAPRSTWARWS